jgi:drug/metabolite transporter (DMT)-like permease
LRFQIAAAFAAVYLIWGSTYLAIRFVIETLPPFFMAGTRFLIAGLFLYVLARWRSNSQVSISHWRTAVVVGGFLLLGGHGAVVFAEQWIPSGLTSLLIATVPLWMGLIDWLRCGSKLDIRVASGLVLGFAGVVLLIGSMETLGGSYIDIIGAAIVVFGSFLWANGSLYSRSAKMPSSPFLATAMEMIAGGLLLLLASLITGEPGRVRLDLVSARSAIAWLYLIVFGSLIAFTSYTWLLKKTTTAKVSTYAYVNPVVAMFLGWALAEESLTIQNVLAAVVILTSVLVITVYGKTGEKKEAKSSTLSPHP